MSRIAAHESYRHLGIALAEPREDRKEVHGGIDAYREAALFELARAGEELGGLALDLEKPLGQGKEAAAELRQLDRAMAADDELHAVSLLELADVIRDRRLAQRQALGRAREP